VDGIRPPPPDSQTNLRVQPTVLSAPLLEIQAFNIHSD